MMESLQVYVQTESCPHRVLVKNITQHAFWSMATWRAFWGFFGKYSANTVASSLRWYSEVSVTIYLADLFIPMNDKSTFPDSLENNWAVYYMSGQGLTIWHSLNVINMKIFTNYVMFHDNHFLSESISSPLVSGISFFPEMVDNVVHSQAWLAVAQTLITGGQQCDYWSFQGYISLSVGWTLAEHCKCDRVCVCMCACVAPGSFTSAEHNSPITNLQMGTFSFSPFLSHSCQVVAFFFFFYLDSPPHEAFF